MTKHTVSDQQASTSPRPGPTSSSPPVDTSDVMDWDLVIETPPPRPSGTIRQIDSRRPEPAAALERSHTLREGAANECVTKSRVELESGL